MAYDFSGYATKVGLKCTDGRTIMQDAFQENDGQIVPLVWQHLHNDPSNILGHAKLENRKDGVYAYCSFNDSSAAQHAREAVKHGDIKSLSIYANSLIEKGKNVIHGAIREVSLVVAGANPGAHIDNLVFAHADGSEVVDSTEALIWAGDPLTIGEAEAQKPEEVVVHAISPDDETLGDIFNSLNEKQKTVVYAMLAEALGESKTMAQSDLEGEDQMKKNVFDKTMTTEDNNETLSHDAMKAIFADAIDMGSLKKAVLAHGITNIDMLFPDAKLTTQSPTFLKRDTGWVPLVFNAARHVPFARIKSLVADVTADEARARGYIKGNQKVDEVITLLKRTTEPQTVYKRQKLDRDDIVDITDFDVVAWMRAEMRWMLEEELARAILVGDGRSTASNDKIQETKIRPIAKDEDLYTIKVELPADTSIADQIDAMIIARDDYKGSGTPTLFVSQKVLGGMLLLKDSMGRRLYNTVSDLAAGLLVSRIVEVPVMENVQVPGPNSTDMDLIGIIVNMRDYDIGADRGGALTMFDDFDINFNQYIYLIETRISGALNLPKSAIVIGKTPTP